MTAQARRVGLLLVVFAGLLLGGASLAWACTPNAHIRLSPNQGSAGDQTTVIGDNFVEGGRVEIRWDGSDGEILAETTGSNFREEVTIPDVPPDDYTIVAVGYDYTGEVAGKGAANYHVQASSPGNETDESGDSQGTESVSGGTNSNDSTSESSGSQETSGQTSASGSNAETDGSPSDGSSESSDSSESTMSPDPSQDSTQSDQSESTQPNPTQQSEGEPQGQSESQPEQQPSEPEPTSQPEPEPQPAPEPQSAPEPQPEPEAGSRSSDGQAAAPSGAEPAQPAPEPASGEAAPSQDGGDEPDVAETDERAGSSTDDAAGRHPTAGAAEPPTPSAQSSSADLWDGLAGGDQAAPGLDAPTEETDELAGAGQQLAVAAGLVGAGLVFLMGGALVSAVRRRPTVAAPTSQR